MPNPARFAQASPMPCDHELLHFLGMIQPHGFVLAVSADWQVARASSNLFEHLGVPAESAIGCTLEEVIGRRATHDVRGVLQALGMHGGAQHAAGLEFDNAAVARQYDVSVHRAGGLIVLECEPSGADGQAMAARVQSLLGQLRAAPTLARLLETMAGHLRSLSGYDRVMAYRFAADGCGEVAAERKIAGMQSFLHLRFPASDIPANARALYLRNPLRMIGDVDAAGARIVPMADGAGQMLDLSMAGLRTVSPVHLEYLRNMGVRGSMSISLIVEGKLWGLLACHHNTPKILPMGARVALESYGLMASAILEAMLRRDEAQARARARDVHQRMLSLAVLSHDGQDNLFALLSELRGELRADGLATFIEGRLRMEGTTPTDSEIDALATHLNAAPASEVFFSEHISLDCPGALRPDSRVAGLMAVPVSRSPRDYILFFRNELVEQVTWAGKPEKTLSEDGTRYSPRQSFAQWEELQRGHSAPWDAIDVDRGEALRVTLLEIMLRLTDAAEKTRKQNNLQQDTLIAELNHRVRNILNLILGLVRQCGENASSVTSFSEDVNVRIHALARAHDQLTSSGWGARSLSNMVRVEAGAYLGPKASRVLIEGADCRIEPDAFATLALVFHELITNAAKYGAFKDSRGHAGLNIERADNGDLLLGWSEHGGNPVKAPTRRGFGSTIIERAIPHELSGSAEVEYATSGLLARFRIPARFVAPESSLAIDVPACAPILAEAAPGPVAGSTILLVEDNLLIALETESVLLELGARSVAVVSSVAAALDFLRNNTPTFAVLDYNLGRENSAPVAERLDALDVPFMFVTGYGDSDAIDRRFRDRPVISKPYDARQLFNRMPVARTMHA